MPKPRLPEEGPDGGESCTTEAMLKHGVCLFVCLSACLSVCLFVCVLWLPTSKPYMVLSSAVICMHVIIIGRYLRSWVRVSRVFEFETHAVAFENPTDCTHQSRQMNLKVVEWVGCSLLYNILQPWQVRMEKQRQLHQCLRKSRKSKGSRHVRWSRPCGESTGYTWALVPRIPWLHLMLCLKVTQLKTEIIWNNTNIHELRFFWAVEPSLNHLESI